MPHKAIEHGWSRAVLTHHIETQLHKREGKAVTNFQRTLPPPQSDLAEQTLKDPYNFDFLTLHSDAHERDLEQGLLDHIQKFLLELGVGFAFVGRQYHMEISGQDYYLDLLFYHLRLRCYIVIDLKMKAFEPEFAGKMNFYLSAVDDQLRHADDRPSIGLLLCKERDHLTVEYARNQTPVFQPSAVGADDAFRNLSPSEIGFPPLGDSLASVGFQKVPAEVPANLIGEE